MDVSNLLSGMTKNHVDFVQVQILPLTSTKSSMKVKLCTNINFNELFSNFVLENRIIKILKNMNLDQMALRTRNLKKYP